MPEGLRDIDANLLLPLYALLQERNLTHAGDRIALSQPAVSGALVRLRKHFGDDLLVRTRHGFELTPLAARLSPLVAEAVEAAGTLLGGPRSFDPAIASKRFTVAISEYAMTVLSEPLTRLIISRPSKIFVYGTGALCRIRCAKSRRFVRTMIFPISTSTAIPSMARYARLCLPPVSSTSKSCRKAVATGLTKS